MKLTWTVQLTVDSTWVEDGFNLTDERALDMLANNLPYANIGTELSAKVIKAPSLKRIAKLQGYDTTKEVLEEIKRGKL